MGLHFMVKFKPVRQVKTSHKYDSVACHEKSLKHFTSLKYFLAQLK